MVQRILKTKSRCHRNDITLADNHLKNLGEQILSEHLLSFARVRPQEKGHRSSHPVPLRHRVTAKNPFLGRQYLKLSSQLLGSYQPWLRSAMGALRIGPLTLGSCGF